VVLADLSLALTVVGQIVPLGGVLLVAAVVPLAVVGARHRTRAVVAGAIAAAAVGFLVIGTPALTTMAACAAFGSVIGIADRRGWGIGKTIAIGTAILFPPIALLVDLALLVFSNLRTLTLDQLRNGWKGLFNFLHWLSHATDVVLAWIVDNPWISVAIAIFLMVSFSRSVAARKTKETLRGAAAAVVGLVALFFLIHAFGRAASTGNHVLTWIIDYWYLSVPIAILFGIVFGFWLGYRMATPALSRVRSAFGGAVAPNDDAAPVEVEGPPVPVPTTLTNVSFRYPNALEDALHDISARIDAAELVAVVGHNGSGKSTLARIIAGRREPTSGVVDRAGPVGMGELHGTAMVFQRPEAQVLGVRVRDDVVWGLRDASAVDINATLTRVGLDALIDRETSTLSGGELQRLAVAAALARQPQLLVSDESTAMVDADGRVALVRLLRDLAHDGVSVVHVSHYANEAEAADRVIALERGLMLTDSDPVLRVDGPHPTPMPGRVRGRPVIELSGVGHVYSRGTPWAKRALADINLTIHERESLLVVGHNGSGKSTLAWIVAGLTVPSEGSALLDGKPVASEVGRVGLSFQHARLQLLRPRVVDDVATAAGVDDHTARQTLGEVGLTGEIVERRVDELSGGQMRRVVLAGVLAARPRVIVLDEPFAGLDLEGRADLERLLLRIRDRYGIALLIVSHDRDLPETLVERVVELDEGRIVRDDLVAESENP
jgi:energy-coupling factor transport system ATP-binding protein